MFSFFENLCNSFGNNFTAFVSALIFLPGVWRLCRFSQLLCHLSLTLESFMPIASFSSTFFFSFSNNERVFLWIIQKLRFVLYLLCLWIQSVNSLSSFSIIAFHILVICSSFTPLLHCSSISLFLFYFLFFWFVRLLALRPLLAYCASLGW
jgi:hypothetical protein